MQAYKFMTAAVLKRFLQGSVRIGSVAEYRAPDGKTGGRSDEREGSSFFAPGSRILSGQSSTDFFRAIGMSVEDEARAPNVVLAEGTAFNIQTNGLIFSASREIGKTLVCRMSDEFGYDACAKIEDMNVFASELTAACVQLQVPFKGRSECWQIGDLEYKFCKQNGPLPEGGIWTKRPEYDWQKEVRIAWPGSAPFLPFIADVPGVKRLTDPVDLSSWK